MECCKSSSERKVYSDEYSKKFRKIVNNQPNVTPQGSRKEKQIKPKVSRRKEIAKIRMEVNERPEKQ